MAAFGVLVLLLLCCSGCVGYITLNNQYYLVYGDYYYYTSNNLPYTIYQFCALNLYNCQVNTYSNFCLTYETTCSYQIATVGGYYYLLLNRYCPVWCNRCSNTYTSACSPTAATTTTTTTRTPAITTASTATTPVTGRTKCEYTNYRDVRIKIAGGGAAYQCDNPWTVAITPNVPLQPPLPGAPPPICQGVLINSLTVATTLECRDLLLANAGPGPYNATVGEYIWSADEPGDEIILADTGSVDFNSGLVTLTLRKPVTYNRCVAPACLPSSDRTIRVDRSKCRITGWGLTAFTGTFPALLMTGEVVVPAHSECASLLATLQAIPGIAPFVNFRDEQYIGCTSVSQSQSAACPLDEGGAVTCAEATTGEHILVGLIRRGGCNGIGATFFTNITTVDL